MENDKINPHIAGTDGFIEIIKSKKKDIEITEGMIYSFDWKKFVFEKNPLS